jgi:membrane fusion protein (multidrug efflux system)
VSGIVIKRVFEQGSVVAEGDVLYRIDPAPFHLQVASSKATLQRAQAAQLLAGQQANRQKELRERNVASAQDLENALALLAEADADVALAQAGLDAANLNLQYADVKAPISGLIGRALITEGALVSANGTENLVKSSETGPASVKLLFDDGTEYRDAGRLLFSESTVDETTGQVTMRAEFPNPDGDLLPGMYVRVLIEQGIEQAALSVPQQAIQRDGSGRSQLYVVNNENMAELRTVQIERTIGQLVVVSDGLKSGDHVIVEGFQKIRPGVVVKEEEWKPANDATSNSLDKAPAG